MSIATKDVQSLLNQVQVTWELLKLDETEKKIRELEDQMGQPDFWTDQHGARLVAQEVSNLKDEVKEWKFLRSEVQNLLDVVELASGEEDTVVLADAETTLFELSANFRRMELKTLFTEPYDQNNALLSIHAGAGGVDAMDWAAMLTRMLTRFAEKRGYEVEVIHESRGEEAGLKSVTLAIRGRFAFGYLKSENGVHRLVRVSPFDAEQMRHTAFAAVEVIPEIDQVSEKNIEIDPKDLRIDTFMSGGKGGQSVNTTYSAVRITHLPTNIVVSCQNERSQVQNRETAMRVLKSRLLAMLVEQRTEKISELRGEHKSTSFGNQIRSYVLHPYKMVKDHRTDYETSDVDGVLGGDLDPFIEAYLRHQLK
jgi:peptide chain release factor 2